jgi:hypothetical protein
MYRKDSLHSKCSMMWNQNCNLFIRLLSKLCEGWHFHYMCKKLLDLNIFFLILFVRFLKYLSSPRYLVRFELLDMCSVLNIIVCSFVIFNLAMSYFKSQKNQKHIRGHLWHIYFVTVNKVMVATVKLSKWWLQLNQ